MAHQFGDERIAEWLRHPREWDYGKDVAYHPRSDKHGAASCQYLLDDLLYLSDDLREAAGRSEIVFKEDHTVGAGVMRWNVDLVLGPPEGGCQSKLNADESITSGEPEEVWLAVDAKSVMSEHGKARRNRQRDINSFADVMHHHHERAVTGGVLLLNIAERFDSPTRDEDDITEHHNVERLVEETIDMFRGIERAEGEISPNVDAVACVVVRHTNMDDGQDTELVTEPPAPQPGDITHYRTFLDILIKTFEDRFFS